MAIEAEALRAILKQHIKVDATGLSPAVASAFVTGFDEAVEAIRSALAEDTARAAEGWERIETAPRDGTMIGVGGGVAMWNEDKECWVSCMHGSVGRPIQWEVTHWKSLDPATIPAAPALPLDKEAADANR